MFLSNSSASRIVTNRLNEMRKKLEGDPIFFYGAFDHPVVQDFKRACEEYKKNNSNYTRSIILLNTPGGSANVVERIVEIIRSHYEEVYFIVPDYAMSAGTIFCMSGDKILMNYASALGPIDPQVPNSDGYYVSALNYLDQYQVLISRGEDLSAAEMVLLNKLDLSTLQTYQQAADLSKELLKKWLVKYKFKDWNKHESNTSKLGQTVTDDEKKQRAEEVAKKLGDNNRWFTHGRFINMETLRDEIRLRIDDYQNDEPYKQAAEAIDTYYDLIMNDILHSEIEFAIHSAYYKNFN